MIESLLVRTPFNQFGVGQLATAILSIGVLGIIIALISWCANVAVKYILLRLLDRFANKFSQQWLLILKKHHVLRRMSHLVPGIIIFESITLAYLPNYVWTLQLIHIVRTIALLYILFTIVYSLMALLNAVLHWYATMPYAIKHPILGYVQIIKIILIALSAIFTISIILDKSPLVFLTGLGAISAVLLLVFKDTISGFVANIQLAAYDMVRVGDWITIPNYGVDGDVIEISINTTKVQNFDKTIVSIPSNALIANGVKNWRGMLEAGGRRIKRAIYIDVDSIHFCDDALLSKLEQLNFLTDHIAKKQDAIQCYNQAHGFINTQLLPSNGRRLTNIGLFRAYAENYLKHHQDIHSTLTLMVRQLAVSEIGLPIELYAFTNDTNWTIYEKIQADIFDHLLASLPMFELKAFQLLSANKISN